MDYQEIVLKLRKNREVFKELLQEVPEDEYLWKTHPDQWFLLEVVCHLHDEEREDFRTRLRYALENPEKAPPAFDTLVWVKERNYIGQNYGEMLQKFLDERSASITWLRSLENPPWDNAYQHPELGPRSARLYLVNWLAHDYLHIRQINKLKYCYLQETSGEDLQYAGNW